MIKLKTDDFHSSYKTVGGANFLKCYYPTRLDTQGNRNKMINMIQEEINQIINNHLRIADCGNCNNYKTKICNYCNNKNANKNQWTIHKEYSKAITSEIIITIQKNIQLKKKQKKYNNPNTKYI